MFMYMLCMLCMCSMRLVEPSTSQDPLPVCHGLGLRVQKRRRFAYRPTHRLADRRVKSRRASLGLGVLVPGLGGAGAGARVDVPLLALEVLEDRLRRVLRSELG